MYALQQNSVRLLLIDSSAVRQPEQENGYAKPPVVALPSGTPTPMRALVPDGGVQAILTGPLPREDPRLAVQVVLGELAQIWLEAPSVSRGIAMSQAIGAIPALSRLRRECRQAAIRFRSPSSTSSTGKAISIR